MRRTSWLDSIVYRFQHHWETNSQYRAAVSGVLGLVLIVSLCTCTGVLSQTAGLALAAVGLGNGGPGGPLGTPNTGTNRVGCCNSFPTATVLYPTNAPVPVSTVPQSQTPPPYPTATETPEATDTPNPGGGGGKCDGAGMGTSWSFSNVCPPVHGQNITFTLSAPKYGGQQIQLEVTCGGALIGSPSPFALPASGIYAQTVTVPSTSAGQPCGGFYRGFGGGLGEVTVDGPPVQ